MSTRLVVIIGAALIVAGTAVGYALWPASQPQRGPADLATGARLYAENCASCHGAALEGEPNWRMRRADGTLPAPPHDASGHTWHHPDGQLFAITKFGTADLVGGDYKSNMRGFADTLSDAEIWAVLDYIKSQWPAEVRARQAEVTARANAGG